MKYRKYIEILYLFRRVLFASFLTFVSNRSGFQIPLLALTLLISLLLNMVCKPYCCPPDKRVRGIDVENTLESFNLSVLLLSFVALAQESALPSGNNVGLWLVVALNCFTAVLCVIAAVIRLVENEQNPMEGPENEQSYQAIGNKEEEE